MIDRRHVMELGMALFREQGYEKVTVNDICRAAGISYGTFFNQFRTKGQFLTEYVLSRYFDDQQVLIAAVQEQTPIDKLIRLELNIVQNTTEIGAALMTVFLSFRIQDPDCIRRSRILYDQLAPVYCELITQAQQNGTIRNQSAPLDLLGIMRDLCSATSAAWAADSGIDWRKRHGHALEILLDVPPELRKYS